MLKVPSNCTTRDGELLRNDAVGLATKQRVLNFLPPIVIANAAFPRHESDTLLPTPVCFYQHFARYADLGLASSNLIVEWEESSAIAFVQLGLQTCKFTLRGRVRRVSGLRR
jgi:hypothetical protein